MLPLASYRPRRSPTLCGRRDRPAQARLLPVAGPPLRTPRRRPAIAALRSPFCVLFSSSTHRVRRVAGDSRSSPRSKPDHITSTGGAVQPGQDLPETVLRASFRSSDSTGLPDKIRYDVGHPRECTYARGKQTCTYRDRAGSPLGPKSHISDRGSAATSLTDFTSPRRHRQNRGTLSPDSRQGAENTHSRPIRCSIITLRLGAHVTYCGGMGYIGYMFI